MYCTRITASVINIRIGTIEMSGTQQIGDGHHTFVTATVVIGNKERVSVRMERQPLHSEEAALSVGNHC